MLALEPPVSPLEPIPTALRLPNPRAPCACLYSRSGCSWYPSRPPIVARLTKYSVPVPSFPLLLGKSCPGFSPQKPEAKHRTHRDWTQCGCDSPRITPLPFPSSFLSFSHSSPNLAVRWSSSQKKRTTNRDRTLATGASQPPVTVAPLARRTPRRRLPNPKPAPNRLEDRLKLRRARGRLLTQGPCRHPEFTCLPHRANSERCLRLPPRLRHPIRLRVFHSRHGFININTVVAVARPTFPLVVRRTSTAIPSPSRTGATQTRDRTFHRAPHATVRPSIPRRQLVRVTRSCPSPVTPGNLRLRTHSRGCRRLRPLPRHSTRSACLAPRARASELQERLVSAIPGMRMDW